MRKRQKGGAVVEAAFMMPWLAFLFVGVLDFGFYSYAAIGTQAAARAAASATSADKFSQNATLTCNAAIGELKGMPNMIGVTTCAASAGTLTSAQPVAVTITTLVGGFNCADCHTDAVWSQPPPSSAFVTVTYQTLPMIPIPGILMKQLTLTRKGEMRVQQ